MPAKAGEIVYLPVTLQTSAGAAAVYADKTALTAAGWAFSYYVAAAAVVSPTWTLTVISSTLGKYQIGLTVQAGQGVAFLTPPSGYVCNVEDFPLDVETNDLDSIATVYATVQGVPGVQSAQDSDFGDIVNGDAWNSGTITIPPGKLVPLGQSTLTGLTLEAAFKDVPATTPVTVTCTAVVAADNTLNVSWQTFPALMALGSTEQSRDWYFDVQCIKAGTPNLIVTGYRGKVRIVWERDTRTS